MTLSPVSTTPVLILGAGLAGLSAAWHLHQKRVPFRHIERHEYAGGHAITLEEDGYRFDRTGHLLHLRDAPMREQVLAWLGDEVLQIKRQSRVFSHGVYTRYPFQANTYGLPAEVAYECLTGYLEAHYTLQKPEPKTFEEFCLVHFGEGFSKHFMIPYNKRLWGVDPREITAAWCQRFVPLPKLEDVIAGAVGLNDRELGYNTDFVYPRMGIGELPKSIERELPTIELNRKPQAIDWKAHQAVFDNELIRYKTLLSTIPLDTLGSLLVDVPHNVAEAFAKLRCTSLYYLDLALDVPLQNPMHWIYVPEERFPYYRVGCYSNFSPSMAPTGKATMYIELVNRNKPNLESLLPIVIEGLIEMGLLHSPQDVRFARFRHIEHAYVIFDHHYFNALATIRPFLESAGIVSVGRYGNWVYSSMEDALLFGRDATLTICQQTVGVSQGTTQ